jgi:hypothetical protein
MMKSMCIPSEFWGEAVTTAVYILNRAATKSLIGMTPYEAWHKRKPKVDHFRTFGCLVHVKIISPHLSKLDDRSALMVFIGYKKGSKAYKTYNPVTKKVYVTRDAIFEENKVWDWNAETGVASAQRTAAVGIVEETDGFRVEYEHNEVGDEYQSDSEDVRQQIPNSPSLAQDSVEDTDHENQ